MSYQAALRWRQNHPEMISIYNNQYYEANKERICQQKRVRRLEKKQTQEKARQKNKNKNKLAFFHPTSFRERRTINILAMK